MLGGYGDDVEMGVWGNDRIVRYHLCMVISVVSDINVYSGVGI